MQNATAVEERRKGRLGESSKEVSESGELRLSFPLVGPKRTTAFSFSPTFSSFSSSQSSRRPHPLASGLALEFSPSPSFFLLPYFCFRVRHQLVTVTS